MIRWVCFWLLLPATLWAQSMLEQERALAAIGFTPGPIDGIADAQTKRAIQEFQFDNWARATGVLTARDLRFLMEMARLGQTNHPFVVDSNTPVVGYDTAEVGTRFLYANGLDYLARWSYGSYNSSNVNIGSSLTSSLREANTARGKRLRAEALALAQTTQNKLSLAVLHFQTYDQIDHEMSASLAGLQTVLAHAEAAPQETALVNLAEHAIDFDIHRLRLCEQPGGEVFYPLVLRVLKLLEGVAASPKRVAGFLPAVIRCAPDDQKEALFEHKLALSRLMSDDAVLGTLMLWATDAERRGQDAIARQKMRIVANHYLAQNPVWEHAEAPVFDGFIPIEQVVLMHRLGMAVEVRKFAIQRMQRIEATNPDAVVEKSFAAMGGFEYALAASALLFAETGQFDFFYRLGVYERLRVGLKSPAAQGWHDPSLGPWYLAVDMLERVRDQDRNARQADLAKIILPEMLKAGAMPQALKVSLIQAKALEDLGRFEDAEEAIVRVVSIAETVGMAPDVQEDVQTLRRKLNLSRLEGLSAAERLLGQMNIYYGEACTSLEDALRQREEFPNIDYDAIVDDPAVAEALLKSDAMNKLLGCFFPERLSAEETRFVCAVAALSGRRDVAEYILHERWRTGESYGQYESTEPCIYGVAYAGHLDWVQPHLLPKIESYDQNLVWYLTLTPEVRQAAIASADMEEVSNSLLSYKVGLQYLEKPASDSIRKALAEQIEVTFRSHFGRIGPGEQLHWTTVDDAVAFQQMGLYRAAEIYFARDDRVDPWGFGKESLQALNDELMLPGHIELRLRYVKLYRAQGDLDRAFDAIGPLAERAIARLGGAADPLPGTVEQWAKRFEPLFVAYLELQFDGISKGPNYPAIFAIQQYLQLANSTASASVLEQRLNSASPVVARQYQDARRALRRALNVAGEGDTRVAELSLRLQSLEAQLPQADAALKSHQIGVTRSLREVVLDLRQSDAAMVVTTQLPQAMVVMYLDGKGARARRLDLGQTAAASQAATFRRGILGSNDKRDLFDTHQAARLYAELIGWGHAGKPAPNTLRLVIDGPFSTLPFAALRRADGWLGAQATLRMAPSVARAATGLRKGAAFRGFVGLGDPNLTKGNLTARTALLGAGVYLPELPETANELTFMALSFGGNPSRDVFTRDQASEAQMQALNTENRLADVSILALATHGLLSRETGALNAAGLVLSLPEAADTDGILTATEIYTYRIGADLVVLSACNTGTPGAGEGLSDLASAFLYAGAGALLLTHWEIDSGAGVEIMKRVAIDQRAEGATDYAASLQKAVAGMLADEGLEKFHHPRFWASHFILG